MDTMEALKALKSQTPGKEIYLETWLFASREQVLIDETSYPLRIRIEHAPRDTTKMRTSTYYQLVIKEDADFAPSYMLSRHMWWYMRDYAIHTSCTVEYTFERASRHDKGIVPLARMNDYLYRGVDGILPEPE